VATGAAGYAAGWSSRAGEEIPDWTYADIPPQQGRRVIVTGGNGFPVEGRSGLGYHQALGLARAGAEVTIASRNEGRGEEAVRRIRQEVPGASIRYERLDLADLSSIADFAGRVQEGGDRLDALVNNAGMMSRTERETSVDGFERTFATNALGPVVLTARLLPLLRKGSDARVVWMARMRGHLGAVNFDDLQKERTWEYTRAYDDTKLMNLLLALECQRRSRALGWGIASIAAHPGVARTNIVVDGPGLDTPEGWRFRYIPMMWQDPAQGALPVLYAATAARATGGGYYGPKGFGGISGLPGTTAMPRVADDPRSASALWTTLEELGQTAFG
jgi:NAD(P)-dependent dehydrogenase (short-subunit alcohol dehydrogenase family)